MRHPQTSTERCTYADHLTRPKDTRYELSDGVAGCHGPRTHTLPSARRRGTGSPNRLRLRGGACQNFAAPFEARLPSPDETDARIEPGLQSDVLAACDPARLGERGMCGAPDWVAEVRSPAGAVPDQTVKPAADARPGVPGVRLLHPVDRGIGIDRHDALPNGRAQIRQMRVAIVPLTDITTVFEDYMNGLLWTSSCKTSG